MNSLGARYQDQLTSGVKTLTMVDKIWEWQYKCMVPAFRSRSVNDIARNGVYVTGIKSLDDGLKDDWTKRYLTINQMVDYYITGVPIRVIDVKDTKDIYDTVQIHLVQWLETIRTGMNIKDAPVEELIAMDRFAGSVYPYAKYLFTPEALESALANQISQTQRVTMTNFFSNPRPGEVNLSLGYSSSQDQPSGPGERESFAERFKGSVESLRKY